MIVDAEQILRIVTATLGEVVGLLLRAFVDGDREAFRRVEQISPDPLRSEAKLAAEEARLRALERGDPTQ